MVREIQLAKHQIMADNFDTIGILSISKWNDNVSIHIEADRFYQLFGEYGSDKIKCEIIGDGHARSEIIEDGIKYAAYYLFPQSEPR